MHDRNVSVYALPSQEGNVLLSGTLGGMTKTTKCMGVHGFNGAVKTKKEGVLKDACSFVDFNGNEFVWDVGFWVGE